MANIDARLTKIETMLTDGQHLPDVVKRAVWGYESLVDAIFEARQWVSENRTPEQLAVFDGWFTTDLSPEQKAAVDSLGIPEHFDRDIGFHFGRFAEIPEAVQWAAIAHWKAHGTKGAELQ